jgi:AGZA family xanthine/uracil permease-like MFS transporter
MNRLDRFFEISARGSTVGAEIRGGVVTFIAMAYIIVLNPIILSSSEDVTGQKLEFAAGFLVYFARGWIEALIGV